MLNEKTTAFLNAVQGPHPNACGLKLLDDRTEDGHFKAMVYYPPHMPQLPEQLKHILDFLTLTDPADVFNVYVRVFAADLESSELDGMFFNNADKDCYLHLMHVLAKMARTQNKFLKEKSFDFKAQYLEYKAKYEELLADTYD